MTSSPPSVLLILPTYNERENLEKIVPTVRAALPDAHLLIVDDNSPDGTGTLADTMAERDTSIRVLHRAGKEGLGRAYVAGMTWGIEHGYDRIVQMDADFSHDPCYLPQLVAATEEYDVAIGSRYIRGGGTRNWGLHRQLLSRGANLYVRSILGQPIHDLTGGFKCWRSNVLRDIDLPSIKSNGYCFQIETTYRALLRGYRATEVPIIFADRVAGQSKMDSRVIREAISLVWRLRLRERAEPNPRPLP